MPPGQDRIGPDDSALAQPARVEDGKIREAYRRLQSGVGTPADWAWVVPPCEHARRGALRAAHPLGRAMTATGIAPLAPSTGPTPVLDGVRQIRAALAVAGLGGMPAHGEIVRLRDDRMPGGYDPLTHEIWMDDRWYRALETFLRDPSRERPKAVTLHALVHEHVHMNSPINRHLQDPGFLDPRQRFLEEACVDTLAQRVTQRLVGSRVDHPTYGPSVETLEWLAGRTGLDVAFAVWREDTLAGRVRRANAAVLDALRLPTPGADEPRWLTRFRYLVEKDRDDLHLLLDTPALLRGAAREVSAPGARYRLRLRLPGRDRRWLLATWAAEMRDHRVRFAAAGASGDARAEFLTP